MTRYRLDHGDSEAGPRYKYDDLSVTRAERSLHELVGESMDKAIAAETKGLREHIIETEAANAAAMIRFADHHQARMKRDGQMMAWIGLLSWAGGVIMCWAFGRLMS